MCWALNHLEHDSLLKTIARFRTIIEMSIVSNLKDLYMLRRKCVQLNALLVFSKYNIMKCVH
jgi:hypothetical protein